VWRRRKSVKKETRYPYTLGIFTDRERAEGGEERGAIKTGGVTLSYKKAKQT